MAVWELFWTDIINTQYYWKSNYDAKMQLGPVKIKTVNCLHWFWFSGSQWINIQMFSLFSLWPLFYSVSQSHSPVFWWLLPGCYIILIWTDRHQCLCRTGQEDGFGVTSARLCVLVFYPSSAACGQFETGLDLGSRFLACLTFWAGTTIASNPIGNSFLQANVFSRPLL